MTEFRVIIYYLRMFYKIGHWTVWKGTKKLLSLKRGKLELNDKFSYVIVCARLKSLKREGEPGVDVDDFACDVLEAGRCHVVAADVDANFWLAGIDAIKHFCTKLTNLAEAYLIGTASTI